MLGKQAKILSERQERLMLAYIDTTRRPTRNRVIFLLSTKGGLRAKEIADRYNISDRTVTRIARCEHEGTKHLTKKEPKYNKRAKKHITKELGEKVYHEYHNTDYFLEDLADKYGISSSLVSLMQLGEHWTTKHLK